MLAITHFFLTSVNFLMPVSENRDLGLFCFTDLGILLNGFSVPVKQIFIPIQQRDLIMFIFHPFHAACWSIS